ncbi:MAG: AMP-binding protein [Myxococcales bacterium]
MLMHDFLDFYAREQPGAEFLVLDDRVLNYSQALEDVNRLSNAMVASGLGVGDRFAFLSKNSIETVITYLAASRCGAVPVSPSIGDWRHPNGPTSSTMPGQYN